MNASLNRNYSRAKTRTPPNRAGLSRLPAAAHQVAIHAAYLSGLDAAAVMKNDAFASFVRRAVFDEILPLMAAPEAAKHAEADEVLAGMLDGDAPEVVFDHPVSQWRAALLPSLLDYHRSRGTVPPSLAFSLAGLVAFCRGRAVSDVEIECRRGTGGYAIREDPAVVSFFSEAWANLEMNGDWYALAYATLGDTGLWGQDLNRLRGFVGTLAQDLAIISTSGPRAAVVSLNAAQS